MVLTAAAPVELKGTLRMDPAGPIAPASMILLRPAGVMTAMPIRITPEADGSFTAPNLAPARYSGFAIEAIGNVLIHVSAVGDFACEIDFVELRQLLAFGVLIQKVSSTFQMWVIWKRSSAVKFLSPIGAACEDQGEAEERTRNSTGVNEYCDGIFRHQDVGQLILSYDSDVRIAGTTRPLMAVLCIALIVLSSAVIPSAAHLDFSAPALVFCFVLVFSLSLLHAPEDSAGPQLISFLRVHTSRAPPLA